MFPSPDPVSPSTPPLLLMSCSDEFFLLFAHSMAGIPVKERVKLSQNWRLGRCRDRILLKWRYR